MKALPAILFLAISSVTVATATRAGADDEPVRPVKPELVAYYKKLDYKSLYALLFDSRRDDIYEKAKTDIGRDLLFQSGNPDPTWIKVWHTRDWSYASGNAETLMQAAFNRTWEAACKAEFEQTRVAHSRIATALGTELAAVDALPNHYARAAGYVALAAKFETDAAAAGLDPRKDPFGPSGFRVEIFRHALAYHTGSRAAYQSFPVDAFPLVREMRERGRPLTTDADFERQAYCGAVSSRGGFAVTSFGSLWGEGHASNKTVAWPTVTGDEKAVAKKVKELIAASAKTLEVPAGGRIGSITRLESASFDAKEPKLAAFSDFVVDAATPDGAGTKLTLSRKWLDTVSYACKETKKIDRIDDNGRIVYRTNCKTGTRSYAVTAAVTFAELPPGVAFAKGDVIGFTADIAKDDTKVMKDTPAKGAWSRKLVATGRILTSVNRGKDKLAF